MTDARRKEAFESLPVPKALAAFIVPTVLSQLITMIYNLADTFFVGHTGDTAQVAAMGIVTPVFLMMGMVSSIFGVGANAGVSAALGAGRRERARQVASFSLWTGLGTICVFALLLSLFMEPFLLVIGAGARTLDYCISYLRWTFLLGCVPTVFSSLMGQLFLAEGESKISGIGGALGGILNILLDPLFIFTFRLGVTGAAIATMISNCVTAIFYLTVYFRRRKNMVLRLHPRHWSGRDGVASSVLLIGIPSGFALLLTTVCDFVRTHFIGLLGTDVDMAAFGVVLRVGNLLIGLSVGMAQGIRPLVAYNHASGDRARMKALMKGSAVVVASFVVFFTALLEVGARQVMGFFLTDGETVALGASYMRKYVICQLGICGADLISAFFQAMGKWKHAMFLTFMNKALLLTPATILLVHLWGLIGVVWVQPITENLTLLIAIVLFAVTLRRMAGQRLQN